MSMVLYALCLHPLLRMLEQRLPGIQIGRRARPTSVVAYDDIIFMTSTDDFPIIEDAKHQYEGFWSTSQPTEFQVPGCENLEFIGDCPRY